MTNKILTRNRNDGFTLIELMIVVAIIGILVAIAIPQYSQYVRESRRSDAIGTLNSILAQQEIYYANNNSQYTTTVANLGYTNNGNAYTINSVDSHYSIEFSVCGTAALSECIQLIATPTTGGAQEKDTECTNFTITSRGTKTSSPSGIVTCWKA